MPSIAWPGVRPNSHTDTVPTMKKMMAVHVAVNDCQAMNGSP